jgi:RNA polymerase sigma factor (sigma-70 family)
MGTGVSRLFTGRAISAPVDRVARFSLSCQKGLVDETLKLVRKTIDGDVAAWTALQSVLDPVISRIARRHQNLRRKGLADQVDDIADVRASALERLKNNEFHNLRSFMERHAEAQAESFDSWLYGVVDYAIRDHLRQRFGRAPKLPAALGGGVQPSKRDLGSRAGRLDDEPERALLTAAGVTTHLAIAEILAFIGENFSADEATAIRLHYLESRSYEEIASSLGLRDSKQAEQLIRRLNARLRYRFAPQDTADQ